MGWERRASGIHEVSQSGGPVGVIVSLRARRAGPPIHKQKLRDFYRDKLKEVESDDGIIEDTTTPTVEDIRRSAARATGQSKISSAIKRIENLKIRGSSP